MNARLILRENKEGSIVLLTLNRPEKRNALNLALIEALDQELKRIESDPSIRVVILCGAGAVFCAGMDLDEAKDPLKKEACLRAIGNLLKRLDTLPQVTIAAVKGAAIAGGAGLMSICDVVIASKNATFGYPEVRRGIVAAQVMAVMARQVNFRDIKELVLLGELVSAERAKEMKLINRVVEDEDVMKEALNIANLAIKGAPAALAQTKACLRDCQEIAIQDALKRSFKFHQTNQGSDEAIEGMLAFLEKRKPKWDQSL